MSKESVDSAISLHDNPPTCPQEGQALEQSLTAYRGAFETDLKNHWHGIQQMTLEAALTGRVARDDDWAIVTRSAENDLAFAARTSGQEYWAHGTLCELALLGPRAGGKRDLDKARAHARLVVDKAREANDSFPIESTRRQISRYIWWWTNAHGYFPGTTDLSADAGELLTVLVLD